MEHTLRPVFQRPLSDKNDKLALLLAFFIGMLLIIIFRGLGLGSDLETKTHLGFKDWLAVFSAIGIIILYTLYIQFTKNRSGLSVDRASDNAYYLGLLFTLITLSISLIKLTRTYNLDDFGGIAKNVLVLLPDFGLALFSTIAGIMARIYLQQLRSDPLDIETEAREELGEAIRTLRSSISEIIATLNSLSEQTKISLTELNNNVNQVIKKTTSESVETIKLVTDNLSNLGNESQKQIETMSHLSTKVFNETKEVLSVIKNEISAISNAPKDFQNSLGQLSQDLKSISETAESASLKQSELAMEFHKIVAQIRNIFTDESFKEIASGIKDLSSTIKHTKTSLENSVQSTNLLTSDSTTLKNNLEAIENVTEEFSNELSKATRSLRKDKK